MIFHVTSTPLPSPDELPGRRDIFIVSFDYRTKVFYWGRGKSFRNSRGFYLNSPNQTPMPANTQACHTNDASWVTTEFYSVIC
jgi:hypothetical protein